ncbi:MAG: hypothetical protein DRJ64_10880, partial [Thermoprotei archaeon]
IEVVINTGHTTTEDGDLIPTTINVTIKAGETSADFTVANSDDNFAEDTETYTVTLSSHSGGGFEKTITGTDLVSTVITDEANPTDPDADTAIISLVGPGTVIEGEVTTDYTVSITQAPLTDIVVTFNYTTNDASGEDYTAVASVTIPAGQTTATFNITTLDDALAEGSEDFSVSISTIENGGLEDVRISTTENSVTTTINDETNPYDPNDSDQPNERDAGTTLSISGDTSTDEGSPASYTLSVTAAPVENMVVDVTVTDVTTNGDVVLETIQVTILAGETTAIFTIDNLDDAIQENAEDYKVSITANTDGGYEAVALGVTEVTTTINDNDAVTVSTVTDSTETEGNGNDLVHTVVMSGESANDETYTFTLVDNTTSGADYSTAVFSDGVINNNDGTITVPVGISTFTISVPVVDDSEVEWTEAYDLSVGGVDATGTILDNENNTVDAVDDGYDTAPQGEFSVTAFVDGQEQSVPDITGLADGGYVIAWSEVSGDSYSGADNVDLNNDGDLADSGEITWNEKVNHDIFLQRYDVSGDAVGDAVLVNTLVTDTSLEGGRDQHDVNVVGLENGNLLVTWMSDDHYEEYDAYDNGSRYLQAQIYDENGEKVCDEFTISRSEYDPIVGLPDGGFIVTWSADARLFNSDGYDYHGVANESANPIDNPIVSDFSEADIDGSYDGKGFGIVAQRYDANGNPVGGRLLVNTEMGDDQIDSDITMLADGSALMTWQSANQDGDGFGVYSQKLLLTVDGLEKDPAASETLINTTTAGDQTDPEVTALSNGTAVITWESTGQGLAMQVVASDGTLVGSEITLSATGLNPVLTETNDGFVVVWQDADEI